MDSKVFARAVLGAIVILSVGAIWSQNQQAQGITEEPSSSAIDATTTTAAPAPQQQLKSVDFFAVKTPAPGSALTLETTAAPTPQVTTTVAPTTTNAAKPKAVSKSASPATPAKTTSPSAAPAPTTPAPTTPAAPTTTKAPTTTRPPTTTTKAPTTTLPSSGSVTMAKPYISTGPTSSVLTASITTTKSVQFKYVQIAVRTVNAPNSDGALDTGINKDLTVNGTKPIVGSRSYPPGSYTAFVAYSLDGTKWVNGPSSAFTIR